MNPDLSDAAFKPNTTYFVEVGKPGKDPWCESRFTTARVEGPNTFAHEAMGAFRVVNADPVNGVADVSPRRRIYIRFSKPGIRAP